MHNELLQLATLGASNDNRYIIHWNVNKIMRWPIMYLPIVEFDFFSEQAHVVHWYIGSRTKAGLHAFEIQT